jgi:hypothetical protein
VNGTNNSRSIRRLRSASLWTILLSLFAIVLFSSLNILTRLNLDDTFWYVAPFIAAIVIVLAIAVYLVALALGRLEARREFTAVLTGEATRDRLIVLLLLRFDFAEPGPIDRAAGQFFSGASMGGGSSPLSMGQLGQTRRSQKVQRKAAAFVRWHEPDDARVSSPVL